MATTRFEDSAPRGVRVLVVDSKDGTVAEYRFSAVPRVGETVYLPAKSATLYWVVTSVHHTPSWGDRSMSVTVHVEKREDHAPSWDDPEKRK